MVHSSNPAFWNEALIPRSCWVCPPLCPHPSGTAHFDLKTVNVRRGFPGTGMGYKSYPNSRKIWRATCTPWDGWRPQFPFCSSLLPVLCCSAAAESLQSCLTLCDPIHGSPPGSAVPGILHARTLEWVAIPFSACKWKVKVKSLSRVRLLETPWTAAHQAPLLMGFSRQRYWSGVLLPSPNFRIHWSKFSFIWLVSLICCLFCWYFLRTKI